MLNIGNTYAQGTGVDAAWPYGIPRNVSAQDAGDGFPLHEGMLRDFYGAFYAILRDPDAGIVPNGIPENPGSSQLLQAIRAIIAARIAGDAISETRVQTLINNAITGLRDGAPGLLDTLNELAAALGDDANFSATMLNNLALKAPIDDPVFTTNQRGVTAAAGDNSKALATTEFVRRDYGVRHLSVNRVADAANIAAGVTTTLGTINVNRTGWWLFVLRSVVRKSLDTSSAIRPAVMAIDGVSVEESTIAAFAGRVGGVRCLPLLKNNGNSVVATGKVDAAMHRYSATVFEAAYMGPSA